MFQRQEPAAAPLPGKAMKLSFSTSPPQKHTCYFKLNNQQRIIFLNEIWVQKKKIISMKLSQAGTKEDIDLSLRRNLPAWGLCDKVEL